MALGAAPQGPPDRRQCQEQADGKADLGRVPVPQCGHCTAFVILTAQDEQRLLRGLSLQLQGLHLLQQSGQGIAGGICRRGRGCVGRVGGR